MANDGVSIFHGTFVLFADHGLGDIKKEVVKTEIIVVILEDNLRKIDENIKEEYHGENERAHSDEYKEEQNDVHCKSGNQDNLDSLLKKKRKFLRFLDHHNACPKNTCFAWIIKENHQDIVMSKITINVQGLQSYIKCDALSKDKNSFNEEDIVGSENNANTFGYGKGKRLYDK